MTCHLYMPQQSYRLVTWLSSSSLFLVMWLAVSQAQVRTTRSQEGKPWRW